jgi:hypothetical protein
MSRATAGVTTSVVGVWTVGAIGAADAAALVTVWLVRTGCDLTFELLDLCPIFGSFDGCPLCANIIHPRQKNSFGAEKGGMLNWLKGTQ